MSLSPLILENPNVADISLPGNYRNPQTKYCIMTEVGEGERIRRSKLLSTVAETVWKIAEIATLLRGIGRRRR